MRAELDPVLVKATLEAGVRLIISIGVTDPNSAQSMKIMIDKLQNFFMTFARITKQLANFERGETLVQILKTRDGEQVVLRLAGVHGPVSVQKRASRSSTMLKALDLYPK